MRQVVDAQAIAKWDALNRRSVPEAPEAVMLLDAFAKIDARPPLRKLPAVVLSGDKPWQPPAAAREGDSAGGVTFADWRALQRRLATSLDAKLVETTRSGHNVHAYAPQLVIDSIREVVESARAGGPAHARQTFRKEFAASSSAP